MSFNDVWEAAKKLPAQDQKRLEDSLRQLAKTRNTFLHTGAVVQFKHTRTGAIITAKFVKMKQKYAELTSEQNKYGRKSDLGPVRWSVPPEMLIPLTAEQARLV
jgi:DNA-binding transcriptional regulator YbjK